MSSPYDKQVMGKMNFRYQGTEYAMLLCLADAKEYHKFKLSNRTVVYLSLGISSETAEFFTRMCEHFGGYVDYDDELDTGYQRVMKVKPPIDIKNTEE